jgi:hypothetical protein
MKDVNGPIKIQNRLQNVLYNRSRHRTHGASKTHMPDFNKMTGNRSREMQDPYDSSFLRSQTSNPLGENVLLQLQPAMSSDIIIMLQKMNEKLQVRRGGNAAPILTEEIQNIDEIDVLIDGDTDE